MMEQGKYKWIVCVRCFTYNQSKYIVDAMNGFTMQQTSFPFVCCIVDDSSTDGEQEIIKKYLQDNFDVGDKSVARNEESETYSLAFAQHKSNRNCFFAVLFLRTNHYRIQKSKIPYIDEWQNNAKYSAICEGDDYWIDGSKLKRQVDLMESDNKCALCYHASKNVFDENYKGKKSNICDSVLEQLTYKDFLPGYPFQTASVLYRANVHKTSLLKNANANGVVSSAILFIIIGQFGYFRGFNEQMSVYRRNAAGVSIENKNTNFKLYLQTQVNICGFFPAEAKKRIIYKGIGPMLISLFLNSRKDFYQMAMYSIKRHPVVLISIIILFARLCVRKFLGLFKLSCG